MSRAPSTFRQLKAALKAAKAAGCVIARAEVDPGTGKITITMIGAAGAEQTSDLDRWMASHAHQA